MTILSPAGRLGLLVGGGFVVGGGLVAAMTALGLAPTVAWMGGVVIGLPIVVVVAGRVAHRRSRVIRALEDGIEGCRSGDFSLRLAVDRDDEVGRMVSIYNEIVEMVGRERRDLRQRELLLGAVIEATPTAVVLANQVGRVLMANAAARELFGGGARLEGSSLSEVLDGGPAAVKAALMEGREAMVTTGGDAGEEAFDVSRQTFALNTRHHHLLLIRRVTDRIRRQEAAVWKRVIRVVGHEINNSLAPIRSLVGTARRLSHDIDRRDRLDEVLSTIDESAAHLHRFVDGYRRVARLPDPQPEAVDIPRLLDQLRNLEPFTIGDVADHLVAEVDPAQLQQVVVNLVRNAREAGSPAEAITVSAGRDGSGVVLDIADCGCGMTAEQRAQAVLPFWSTKPGGSGLGLALCREILEAHHGSLVVAERTGGGTIVRVRLPSRQIGSSAPLDYSSSGIVG
jgi:nitrogen fixation/metabolism regulation signal transduction histidine kinase